MGDHTFVCDDCGTVVATAAVATHTRFHSILSSHGWALAVIQNAHLAEHVHNKYDVRERIKRRKFDNWSADALAEVMRTLPVEVTQDDCEVCEGEGTLWLYDIGEPWGKHSPSTCGNCDGVGTRRALATTEEQP